MTALFVSDVLPRLVALTLGVVSPLVCVALLVDTVRKAVASV